MLELLKIIVQPVALERDDDGKIIGEKAGEPTPLYSFEQLQEFWAVIEQQLLQQQNGDGAADDSQKGEASGIELLRRVTDHDQP